MPSGGRMQKKSFVKGAAILAAAGLIVKLIGAVYRIPLSNIVGADAMGYYEVVYRYYAWLLVISSAGLPTAISRMVAQRVCCQDYRGAHQVFRTAFFLLLGIGVVTTLFMFFGADLLSGITYAKTAAEEIPKQALSFRALAPSLLLVSLMCAYRGYLQGLQLMTGTAASQVMEQVGKLGFGLVIAHQMIGDGPQYAAMGALIGVSISELLGLVVIYFFYARQRPWLRRQIARSPKRSLPAFGAVAKRLGAIALPITIGASIMPLTGIIDSALVIRILQDIGFAVTQARLAYSLLYSFVTPIINMPAVLTVALAMSLVPAISGYLAQRDYRSVQQAASTGMKLAITIGTPCSVGMFVLARPILAMLFHDLPEEQLALAAELMQTACVGVVFLSLVQTLTGIIQGMGRQNVPVLNLLFGGIIKVVVMVILTRIERINIQGAAVSTVACYAAAGILDMVYLIRKARLKVNAWDMFGKPILASGLMGAAVHFAYQALPQGFGDTKATLVAVVAGVALYALLAVVLRFFSREDLALIPGGARLTKLLYRGRK